MRARSLLFATTFALALAPSAAHATGMQGHVYMAMCAAEQLPEGKLKTVVAAHEMRLINGGFFPDSGYTSKTDHDQGEIPHWEQYVQGFIEEVRARYPSPWTDPEGQKQIAFVLGLAAHGITDSTFDTMIYSRAEQVDPGSTDDLDMSMDVYLVADLKRELVPTLDFDSKMASDVFGKHIKHPVTPEAIDKAMSTARSGMGAVVKVLAPGVADFAGKFPWARKAILDPRVPGSYGHGSEIVRRYWEELAKRIDGDLSADGVVIGTYPDASHPLVTLDHTRVDARLTFFFGHGLDRTSVTDDAIVVLGPDGKVVPTKMDRFRGDQWLNAIVLLPDADWLPDTEYTIVVKPTLRTLNGASPSAEQKLTFSTKCATTPTLAGCPASLPKTSLCPLNDARFQPVPEVEEPTGSAGSGGAAGNTSAGGEGGSAGRPTAAPSATAESENEGGCAVGPPSGALGASVSLLSLGLLSRRRRRR